MADLEMPNGFDALVRARADAPTDDDPRALDVNRMKRDGLLSIVASDGRAETGSGSRSKPMRSSLSTRSPSAASRRRSVTASGWSGRPAPTVAGGRGFAALTAADASPSCTAAVCSAAATASGSCTPPRASRRTTDCYARHRRSASAAAETSTSRSLPTQAERHALAHLLAAAQPIRGRSTRLAPRRRPQVRNRPPP